MQEIQVWPLGQEDPLEKEMTTHFSILAWKILWTGNLMGFSLWGRKALHTTTHACILVIKAKHLKSTQMSWGWYMWLPLLLQSPGVPRDFRIEWHLVLRGCSVACLPVTHFKRSGSHSEPQRLWEMWSLPPSISPCLGCTSNTKYSCPPYL